MSSVSADAQHVSSSTAFALEAVDVSRRFGTRKAVDGVSLALGPGECLALFGPNGAGKTTLLRMLGGLLKPATGRVLVHGQVVQAAGAARRLVGLISHHSMLYAALTARENVRFAAECHGVRDADGATEQVLRQLRIFDRAETPVRLLSRGLQQRVSIARALVHAPKLVLLDEPYTGLDDVGARALTDALVALRDSGATLVLVTHHLGEGLALATRAAIMLGGRIAHDEPVMRGDAFDVARFSSHYRGLVAGTGE